MEKYDNQILTNEGGQFVSIGAARGNTDRANFVICSHFGNRDWSGFVTLAELDTRLPELLKLERPDGYFVVVER